MAHHTVAKAEIAIYAAQLYQQTHQFNEVKRCLDDAMNIARKARNMRLGARILYTLGEAFYEVAQFDLSQACWEQSMAVYSREGDIVGFANCLNQLGNLYNELGHYSLSDHHLESAQKLWVKLGNLKEATEAGLQRVALARHQQQYFAGFEVLDQARQTVVGESLAEWWYQGGRLLAAVGNTQQALEAYQKSQESTQLLANRSKAIAAALVLQVRQGTGDFSETLTHFDTLYSAFSQHEDVSRLYLELLEVLPQHHGVAALVKTLRDKVQTRAAQINNDVIRSNYLARADRRQLIGLPLEQ
jgi:tetratricopeptide (TPR) repeat protein